MCAQYPSTKHEMEVVVCALVRRLRCKFITRNHASTTLLVAWNDWNESERTCGMSHQGCKAGSNELLCHPPAPYKVIHVWCDILNYLHVRTLFSNFKTPNTDNFLSIVACCHLQTLPTSPVQGWTSTLGPWASSVRAEVRGEYFMEFQIDVKCCSFVKYS